MSKIGERSSGVSTLKPQQAPAAARTQQVSAQQLAARFGGLMPTATTTKSTFAPATATRFTAAAPSGPAAGPEVLPNALGPLTEDRMNRCIDEAYRDTYQGAKLPSGQDRGRWMEVAKKMRADNPKLNAEELRTAIADKLRLERDGMDSAAPANVDKFIQDAASWVAQCYGGSASVSPQEMNKWRAFAAEQMKKPDMTPEKLKYAIQDALRAERTGMTTGAGGGPNVDKFIQDAASWVAQCYGGSASVSPQEMNKWRAFAAEEMKKPDMTPEKLKYAIQDALRAERTGMTTGAGGPNVDKFIQDAASWVAQCYGGSASVSPQEMNKWRAFAAEQMKKPDMTPEKLKYAIQDALRAERTGMTNGAGGPNVDKFIQDAASWVAQCYGGSASVSPQEMNKWRAFAAEQMKKPDMTPEKLKYAIQDAIRAERTGTGGAAGTANVDKLIEDAYSWVFQAYRGQPAHSPRKPTTREMEAWRKFAQDEMAKKPDMTAEALKYLIQDSLRIALNNQ